MVDESSPITRKDFHVFMSKFSTDLADNLNKVFEHVAKRLDDIDRRLGRLEMRMDATEKGIESMGGSVETIKRDVHYMKNDLRLVEPIYKWVVEADPELNNLNLRVGSIENRDEPSSDVDPANRPERRR